MCSELFRIPYSWGGVPIFGIGVLLAIWAVASALTLVSLVRRHGWSGETLSTIPVLVLLGAAIVGLPKMFPDGFPVRGYGVMLLLGISAGVGLVMYRAQKIGLNPELILTGAIWVVVGGIIGARLFYVVEYWGVRFGRGSLQTNDRRNPELSRRRARDLRRIHRRGHRRICSTRASTSCRSSRWPISPRQPHDWPGVRPHRLLPQRLLLRR